jgi:branched-subunit amino acid ABC-type transport system permease component
LRWKLIVIASLAAALIGAATSYSLFQILAYYSDYHFTFITKLVLAEICPFVTSCLVAVFVYRHTARRRKTQALITLLLSLIVLQVLLYFFLNLPPINLGTMD